jgi:CHAT domain-containing protein
MKNLFIGFVCLLFSFLGGAQNNILEDPDYIKFSELYYQGRFTEADNALVKLRQKIKKEDYLNIFILNTKFINLHTTTYDFVKSDSLIKENEWLIDNKQIPKQEQGYFTKNIGKRYLNSKEFTKAISIYKNSLKNSFNIEDSLDILNSISSCYININRSDSAIQTLTLITKKSTDDWNLSQSHHLLSRIYASNYNDLKKASYHFHKSVDYSTTSPLTLASFYGEYGQILNSMGKNEDAIKYLKKSLEYINDNIKDNKHPYYGITYSILARTNNSLNNDKEAIELLLKANKTNIRDLYKKSNSLLIEIINGHEGNRNLALEAIRKIIFDLNKQNNLIDYQYSINEIFGKNNWITSDDLQNILNLDSIINNYNDDFKNLLFQYHLKTFEEGLFSKTNVIVNKILNIDSEQDKLNHLEKILPKLPKNELYKTILLNKCYSLLKINENEYSFKLFKLIEKEFSTVNNSYCYGLTNKFLAASFTFDNMLAQKYESLENTRANNLTDKLKKLESKNNKTIPNNFIISEKNTQEDINTKLRNLNLSIDKVEQTKITKELDSLYEILNGIKIKMEMESPKYYKYKYENSSVSIDYVQNTLGENELIYEYFIYGNQMFNFIISKSDYNIEQIKINSTFTKNIALFRKTTSDYTYITQNPQKAWEEYTSSAKYLYDKLFPPKARELLKGKSHIYVIPDGELNTISFEALLKEKPKTKERDYKNLAYLINDFDISYAYSATLLFKTKDFRTPTKEKLLTYGGFAPEYDQKLLAKAEELENFRAFRSNPSALANNKNEVSAIAKLFKGDEYFSLQANEKNFKENAGKYKVLHLAMHALTDDEDPLYSKFLFTNTKGDSIEDNYLNAYELYNMELNADLAVLSACNTGYGKIEKGEGAMSLARAFKYAGCPSIVMSLWQADDEATSALMIDFFKNLKQSNTKSVSLRDAKLNYLKQADNITSQPYFWSNFVVLGDNTPIELGYNYNWVWWLLGLILSFVIIFKLIKMIFKKNNSKIYR